MAFIQENRPIAVKTPLSDDVLLLRSMSGAEQLGRLFQFDLDLLSEDFGITLDDVLGQSMTVQLNLPEGELRYFNGIVSRFCQVGQFGDFATYQATLRPWFWFLTRTSDCRIFQNKTVPDIIKEVFGDNGFSDFEESLSGEYREWEYCVQYRETDFNFISRLMEQEGIYYYFAHEDGKHILKLSDSISAHEPILEPDVPYFPPSENVERDLGYIHDWFISRDLQPGAYVQRDFDFKNPKANLETMLSNPFGHDKADYETYDYPGEYVTADEGNTYVRTRLEELHAKYERVRGDGNVRTLFTGGLFNLTGYPREDQNREYLVVSAAYDLQTSDFERGAEDGGEEVYSCSFEAMSSRQPYRSSRITPKPIVQGPQTATVVGPSGDEIYTDEYGRVKVQFHWDRYGEEDENSSCWIRVSHPWAGKKWGGIALPRIGQEVIISFLEGDPDRPILTGRVYNADNMPPYELPANKTQSGVKSRSSKGGTGDNFNEIRFEDKIGSEEMYIHAEKDQNSVVENDQSTHVQHDQAIVVDNNREKHIGVDQKEVVGNNKIIEVGANHTETIGANMDLSVASTKSESVGSNSSESIVIAKTLSIGAAYQVSVGAAMNVTVGAAKAEEIGGYKVEAVGLKKSVSVGGDSTENIGGSKSLNISKDRNENIGGKHTETVKKEYELKAKKILLQAEDEIIIKVGKAKIVMKKNGQILIQGKDVSTEASGKINIKASSDITMKGSKIKEN